MEIYLTIMVTILVITQVIRLTQNAIQLRRQTQALESDPNKQLLRLWDKLEKCLDDYIEK